VKVCPYCEQERPDESFAVAVIVNGKVYRRRKCYACKYARQKERIRETADWLLKLKKTLACERCGFSDHRALQFHHRDPNEKEFAVGDIARKGGSLKRLKRELEKCIVLCANCHCIEHFKDGGA